MAEPNVYKCSRCDYQFFDAAYGDVEAHCREHEAAARRASDAQVSGEWTARSAFYAADRALAVPHREDDQPCGCDDCMDYGAEDAGFSWYKTGTARRIVLRALDSGDDRFAPIVTAFREHEAESATPVPLPATRSVERLQRAIDAARDDADDAEVVARYYEEPSNG